MAMSSIDLHIVTFAVPYPPTYGGAIDVWNRLKALHAEGVKIHLHCFIYGQHLPQSKLQEVASEIHYYPRSVWPVFFAKGQPFVISSRQDKQLLKRLKEKPFPVFFESMQTTGWLEDLPNQQKFLRAHNVEHQYYHKLSQNSGGFRSMIYSRESQCLEDYECAHAKDFEAIFSISEPDHSWFISKGGKSFHIPPFHGIDKVEIDPGTGKYLLYQGDLSIEINQRAILDLVRMIPEKFSMPFVVAGRAGDQAFESKIASFPNIRREADVSPENMISLVRHAQVILVHSLHAEGMKMKLFPALYSGRFIMANSLSATHTALDEAIHFYEPDNFISMLTELSQVPFDEKALDHRKQILTSMPDDATKARQIIRYL
jgi:hypothetical protein